MPSNHILNQTIRFTEFGGPIHQRPVQDLAFAVARFIQKGGSFVNYYMVCFQFQSFFIILYTYFIFKKKKTCLMWLLIQYHGGTNFGRSAGGPFITTSYDYDAPLDEYGDY